MPAGTVSPFIAAQLGWDPVLVFLAAGFGVANFSKTGHRLLREIRDAREPRVVLSSEGLAYAKPEAIQRIVNDLDRARVALEQAGFIYGRAAGIEMFLDGPAAKARDAVHVIFAGERVRPEYVAPVPDVAESVSFASYRVLSLEAVVRMKLTSYRDKDKMHVRDMIEVGLVNATWPARYPPELAARLQHLLDTPDG